MHALDLLDRFTANLEKTSFLANRDDVSRKNEDVVKRLLGLVLSVGGRREKGVDYLKLIRPERKRSTRYD